MTIKLLTISDVVVELLYSPQVCERFADVDVIISCGDLPYYYLDYIVSNLNIPLFYVRGNHANRIEYTVAGPRSEPLGGIDLHLKNTHHLGLLMAGVQGSVRYNRGLYQYTQGEMWMNVARLIPRFLINRIIHGRYLDIFISHAPPWKLNDATDRAHQGIKAFRWLLKTFRPGYHFHGHIHPYHPNIESETSFYDTKIINAYGYREHTIQHRG